MKYKYCPNNRLNSMFTLEQNNQFANRLKFVKPSIDSCCPKSYSIFEKYHTISNEKSNMSKSFSIKIIFYLYFIF